MTEIEAKIANNFARTGRQAQVQAFWVFPVGRYLPDPDPGSA